jgi:hypothetical protein
MIWAITGSSGAFMGDSSTGAAFSGVIEVSIESGARAGNIRPCSAGTSSMQRFFPPHQIAPAAAKAFSVDPGFVAEWLESPECIIRWAVER